MKDRRGAYKFYWGDVMERDYFEDLVVDESVILKWIFKKCDGAWTGLFWFKTGTVGRLK
jgi:hypothetical protein